MEQRPTAGTCPWCGSAAFTRVKEKRKTAPTGDRERKECGIRHTTIPAALSSAVRAAIWATGVLLLGPEMERGGDGKGDIQDKYKVHVADRAGKLVCFHGGPLCREQCGFTLPRSSQSA